VGTFGEGTINLSPIYSFLFQSYQQQDPNLLAEAIVSCLRVELAQTTTDDEHGLIISQDVVNAGNDKHQLTPQLKQACEVLGKEPEYIVADKGYSNLDDF